MTSSTIWNSACHHVFNYSNKWSPWSRPASTRSWWIPSRDLWATASLSWEETWSWFLRSDLETTCGYDSAANETDRFSFWATRIRYSQKTKFENGHSQ